jgi:hypothetical protein
LEFDPFNGSPEGVKCRIIHRGANLVILTIVVVVFSVKAKRLCAGRTVRVFRVWGIVLGPFSIQGDLTTVGGVRGEFRSSKNKSFGLRLRHDAKTITCCEKIPKKSKIFNQFL